MGIVMVEEGWIFEQVRIQTTSIVLEFVTCGGD